MSLTIIAISLALVTIGAAILVSLWITRRSRKCTPDGMPRVGTKWETWDGKEYTTTLPSTDPSGKPVDPMLNKGAFSFVVKRNIFHKFTKP